MLETALTVARRFALPSAPTTAEVHRGGHINDSFLIHCTGSSGRFLLQRVNGSIFPHPRRIMENIARVTSHAVAKLGQDCSFLRLVPTSDGQAYLDDPRGDLWRCYVFIEGAMMQESATTPAEAAEAGRAVGAFQALLADLPGERLHEILPRFHDTPHRYENFDAVLAADAHDRARACAPEIAFAQEQRPLAPLILSAMQAGRIPERPVHNDAKMSNVLLDAASGRALCVVDLDTLMPGSVLYDFGDMMRTMLCPAAEDERDLSQVRVDPSLFAALTAGYLKAARPILNEEECAMLVRSGILITLETGLRFLSDHLNGDQYFRIERPGQNLDRARTQFALVASMQAHRAELESLAGQALRATDG